MAHESLACPAGAVPRRDGYVGPLTPVNGADSDREWALVQSLA